MKAALEMLERDGILAGINVSEVAKQVGVTPANVYHFFGSRRGLLRNAISTIMPEVRELMLRESWEDSPSRMFGALARYPHARLWALLALDHDPEFETVPAPARRPESAEEGSGDPKGSAGDLDQETLFHMLQVGALGYAIFRESSARQLGLSLEELDEKAGALFSQLADSLILGS